MIIIWLDDNSAINRFIFDLAFIVQHKFYRFRHCGTETDVNREAGQGSSCRQSAIILKSGDYFFQKARKNAIKSYKIFDVAIKKCTWLQLWLLTAIFQLETWAGHAPVAVIVELVVAGHGDEAAATGAERVENLRRRVAPNLKQNSGKINN